MIFKKYLLTLAVGLSLALPAKSQVPSMPVIDLSAIMTSIDQFIEQKYMHAENIYVLGEQLSTALQNLDQAKENIRLVRKTFSVAGQFFDDANVLVDLYDNMELLKLDYLRLKNQVTYYQNHGKIHPAQLYATYRVVDQVSGRMYDTFKFTKDQILNSDNHLTLHERMQMLEKVNMEFRRYHSLIKSVAAAVDEDSMLQDIEDGNKITSDALRRHPSEQKVSINDQQFYRKAIEELRDPRSVSTNPEDPSTNPEARKTLQVKIINIVGYAITILAVLFFGWNFGVYNHGDRQRSDVLWKVGAGYLIMMVVLQIFKTVFFNL